MGIRFTQRALCLAAFTQILTGCLPSAGIARFQAAEAIAENEIDAVVAFAVDRLCQLKVDIMARAAARNADMARAMYYACPDVRSLMMTTLQAVGNDGLKVEFRVSEE
jgi:hypothetical protein